MKPSRRLPAALLLSAMATAAAAGPSTLIRNVLVIDGSGAAPYTGAVRIEDGRITEAGPAVVARSGETVRDGHGQVLAPGFIDTHSHHDRGLREKPTAAPLLSQGITTIVVGQDGSSTFPLSKLWDQLQAQPAAVNVASYSGHNTLREQVLGEDYKRHSTPAEIARMSELLEADMRAGAIGLSSGLGYDPGIYSAAEETVALGKVVAPFGGRYISHIRSESLQLWSSIDELLRVGREARIPVQLSHAKLAMVSLWGQAPKLVARLEAARAEGIDATLDVYPYEYWQSTMQVVLPQRNFEDVETARSILESSIKPEGILFGEFDADPSIVGKTLAQVAAERKADPAELYLALIRQSIAENADESIIGTSMRDDDITTLMQWSHANICSDGAIDGAHPRGAGSFTRVLRKYVRENKALSLQDAVHRMTGKAAGHMGLADRGYVRPGLAADLVLFDPATVSDHATTKDPRALSTDITAVWVGGELVWDAGAVTGKRPGKVLRAAQRAGG